LPSFRRQAGSGGFVVPWAIILSSRMMPDKGRPALRAPRHDAAVTDLERLWDLVPAGGADGGEALFMAADQAR
jgi:hypothetical protein